MVTNIGSLDWLQTLADATRVRLLRLLAVEELSVTELCSAIQLPQSTVSRHLKLLADGDWIAGRKDGTIHLYRTNKEVWSKSRNSLWDWVSDQALPEQALDYDLQRMRQVVAQRKSRSEQFFSAAAEEWDRMRVDLFGQKLDAFALSSVLPSTWIVGELGCGSAPLAHLLSPFVRQVIAVDSSSAMLAAAKTRLAGLANVHLESAELHRMPISDSALDAAWLVLVLPYLPNPAEVLTEAARVLKSDASLVIIDLLPHDRQAYRFEMGHLRLGTDREELEQWCHTAGLRLAKYQLLPPEPVAKGPGLFAASAVRN